MTDYDSRALQSPQTTDAPPTIDDRDVRALTNPMTVLDDVDPVADELPAVAGERGVYLVVSHSGAEHVVDATEPRCTCSDFEYRDVRCKHLRRVAFATGERELPNWANADAVDDGLGDHVRRVATDGGSIDEDDEDVVGPLSREIEVDIGEVPSLEPDESDVVAVEVTGVHLSLLVDGFIRPSSPNPYRPVSTLHEPVRKALEDADLDVVRYQNLTIDVPLDGIYSLEEQDIDPYVVSVRFRVEVESFVDDNLATDGGTIAPPGDDDRDSTGLDDSIDAQLQELPALDRGETGVVSVVLDGAHLSLATDSVLRQARDDSAGERPYRPRDRVHAHVVDALDAYGLSLVDYRDVSVDVSLDDDETIRTATVTFRVEVAPLIPDGGTIATDAGASTPTSSTSETESDDAGEQLPDDVDPADVAVADTGAGLLVYVVEREYRSHIDRETEVAREIIGFADVQDWDAIDEAVRARGHGHGDVLHLPEFDVDELPDPVDGNGGDDR